MKRTKAFIVAAVSSNLNDFGLAGLIVIARDGSAYEVGANHLAVRPVHAILDVPLGRDNQPRFADLGFEIPKPMIPAPPGVVEEVWRGWEDHPADPETSSCSI